MVAVAAQTGVAASQNTPSVQQMNPFQQITCSSLSGSLGIFVGFPFDTIKTKLQTQEKGTYRGVVDCLTKTVKNEGFRRLYSGLMAPLSVASIRQSVIFGSNRVFNSMLDIQNTIFNHKKHDPLENYFFKVFHEIEEEIEEEIEKLVHSQNFKLLASGVLTGVCNRCSFFGFELLFVVTPSDQIKIQMQSGDSSSMLRTLKHIYAKKGVINGIYRGWRASVTREMLYYGAYFISYEHYRFLFAKINPFSEHGYSGIPSQNIFHPATMFNTLISGGLAGCTSWIVNLPADYVKSRLQGDSIDNPKYKGMKDCAIQTYKAHGTWKVFYTGMVPTLVRAFPVHATILLSYELFKQMIM
ncbi:solute carrier family 25 member [Acrasis kona]|uniref:Solute carrier family 25 member n=1 Tax=Acrasis kona TaxID=1008807 RepID=A0AAW2Z954_9EUKA